MENAPKPRLIMEYIPDKEAKFVRLYDKEQHPQEGAWLFPPALVSGKTPDQLRSFFSLPFTPKFICDAVVAPGHKIYAWATPSSAKPNVYEATGGVSFSNERIL